MGGNHGIDLSDVTQGIVHEGGEHFRITENVLIKRDGVIGVSQLGLSVGEDASDTDRAGSRKLPMSTKGCFILLVEKGVHYISIDLL